MTPNALRKCRNRLRLSQAAFAAKLGVLLETYRTWDSGRRESPANIVTLARQLAAGPSDDEPVPLVLLAPLIGVHVRTLRHAARMGRLQVTYDTRTTFRQVRRLATRRDADVFLRTFYRQTYSRYSRHAQVRFPGVPNDYDAQVRALRHRLDLSQARFAKQVGAASRAVVYQWESQKRIPSPLFCSVSSDCSQGHASRGLFEQPRHEGHPGTSKETTAGDHFLGLCTFLDQFGTLRPVHYVSIMSIGTKGSRRHADDVCRCRRRGLPAAATAARDAAAARYPLGFVR
jgi:DNA-binding transcriptional regulator YiaG